MTATSSEPASAMRQSQVAFPSETAAQDADGSGLRILHVINSLELGGTQSLLARVDRDLRRRGFFSHVCVLGTEKRTHESYRDLNSEYLGFHGDYRRPFALWSCIRRLREVISRVQPDIVHSYLWTSDFAAALAVRRGDVCHVSHIVDRRDWLCSDRWVHVLRKRATQQAFQVAQTRFLAVSQAARDFAVEHLKIDERQAAVAYNGIDWDAFPSEADEATDMSQPLLLGTAGRLEDEKGHCFLIESVKQLLDRGCDVRLEITGEGALRGELESQVKSLGIGDRVRFLGWVADVRAFYRRIDLFVVPSVSAEGLPTTILEAMASRCVVIASDVGGAGEAIEDGVSGVLVPPADVGRLTESIEQLFADPVRFEALANAARRRIESRFTTRQMVNTIVRTYHDEVRLRSNR